MFLFRASQENSEVMGWLCLHRWMHLYSRGSHRDRVHIELGIAQMSQKLSCHPAVNCLISHQSTR